jgi:hypothetical protein
MSMKNPSDTIGNRICDLPAHSTVPQPIAPPRAPKGNKNTINSINLDLVVIPEGMTSQLQVLHFLATRSFRDHLKHFYR